jgi:LytR cell envelope-related transcriptional attenuator
VHPRLRDRDRGVALPAWALGVSIGVVVLAMLAFVVTGSPDGDDAVADPRSDSGQSSTENGSDDSQGPDPSSGPADQPPASNQPPASDRPPGQKPADDKPQRPDQDHDAYVEVYNNSGIAGLANETAAQLQDAGWQVVGADNWYGDIPASTVYYPERLHDAAKQLAADLGIKRLHTAVAPMRFDRLTLILTGRL